MSHAGKDDRLRLLFDAAQQGDETAEREFLATITPRLLTYLAREFPQYKDDIEDVVQDTVIELLSKLPNVKRNTSLFTFCRIRATWRLLDRLRQKRRRVDFESRYAEYYAAMQVNRKWDTERSSDENYDESLISRVLEQLPERDGQVIKARFFARKSFQEIADEGGGPSAHAVEVRVGRCLPKLKKLLEGLTDEKEA